MAREEVADGDAGSGAVGSAGGESVGDVKGGEDDVNGDDDDVNGGDCVTGVTGSGPLPGEAGLGDEGRLGATAAATGCG